MSRQSITRRSPNERLRESKPRRQCRYHAVFIPKYRKKATYGEARKEAGESYIEEGHLMPDHVHIMISIPPTVFPRELKGP